MPSGQSAGNRLGTRTPEGREQATPVALPRTNKTHLPQNWIPMALQSVSAKAYNGSSFAQSLIAGQIQSMSSAGLCNQDLRQPADRGVRQVAQSLIREADKAADDLSKAASELTNGEPKADELLHDFRVAVRRLRSWLRAFEPWIDDDLSRKQRRRLGDAADATRVTRDATVHLEWLHDQRDSVGEAESKGYELILDRIQKLRGDGVEDAIAAASDFGSLTKKVSRNLETYSAPVDSRKSETFGRAYCRELNRQIDKLQRRLSMVHEFDDLVPAHRARIAAKNLRYLIEPASKLVGDGEALIHTLKSLQDSLGDLHDVHVFVEELADKDTPAAAAPGVDWLARRLRERGGLAFAEVERAWLDNAGDSFFDRVRDFGAQLAHIATLGSEIEHKYLLKRLPRKASRSSSVKIVQGYVPGEKIAERIRRVEQPDGTRKWYRTIKVGSGLERMEIEEETSDEQARAIWRLTRGNRLRKRRYSIRESDDLVWEVDRFLDRHLVLAEIELPTADTEFEIPRWLEKVLVREVTEEPEYSNAQLAAGQHDIRLRREKEI